MRKIIVILFLILGITVNMVIAKEESRYDRNAIPKIPDNDGSGVFDTGMPEKEVRFIGRISSAPYVMPKSGTVNLIVCEDWRGRPNVLYKPDDFCGAKISNGTYIAYAYPMVVQIPANQINGNISLYSVAKIKGYLLPEIFYVDTIWGILTDPIIYANELEIISEENIIEN